MTCAAAVQAQPASPAPAPPPAAAPPAAAPSSPFAGARFSTVEGAGGVPLNVVERGDPARPSLLLLHGYRQSYLSWWRQFDSALAERCHLVAIDLRGHGNSGQPWQPEAYDNSRVWADDIARVIAAKGLTRPLLVGWSFGGSVAMDYLRHHGGAALAGLVLVGTGAGIGPPPPAATDMMRALRESILSADLEANLSSRQMFLDMVYPLQTVAPAMRAQLAAVSMRVSPWVDRGLIRRQMQGNADVASSLRLPVTLVFGGRDPIVPPPVAERLKQVLPQARVVNYDSAGHVPFIDEAAAFNTLLERQHCAAR